MWNLNLCKISREICVSHTHVVRLWWKMKIIRNWISLILCLLLCFGYKMFSEKYFCHFRCLVGVKLMVNENHFQFDRKSLFDFWKTIYSFENHKLFSGFKFLILARTFVGICHCWALMFIGNLTLPSKIYKF